MENAMDVLLLRGRTRSFVRVALKANRLRTAEHIKSPYIATFVHITETFRQFLPFATRCYHISRVTMVILEPPFDKTKRSPDVQSLLMLLGNI